MTTLPTPSDARTATPPSPIKSGFPERPHPPFARVSFAVGGRRGWRQTFGVAVALVSLFAAPTGLWAAEAAPASPDRHLPSDIRLQELKDLDGYFPFNPPTSVSEWTQRAERVRRQILVAEGLWPMPAKTPLKPVIHGRTDLGDYTVEKVYFESLPGFYVTGSLFRPKGKTGPVPGVLCPHGHWSNGRFYDVGRDGVRRQIVEGAERFEVGGRNPLQARCVQLARMGCVVFHYDMIGYADSRQLSEQLVHGFSKQRPEMNTTENWGLFSPQAEAHLQSAMGLQTWDSIRSLDFLLSLPEVDPQRIAVTGASGGGTQTFILCAIDPRPALAFPAVMVSTAMQGGCTCENASDLRVGTGNVEFAALFAPKPLGMTCADDWTREMPVKGYPQLKQLYALLGAPDLVMLKRGEQFPHNYNYVSRAAMYAWVNRHFKLGVPEPVVEEDYSRLAREALAVWDAEHPEPAGGPDFERKLLRWLTDDANQQLREAQGSLATFQRVYGGALEVMLGRTLAESGEVKLVAETTTDRGSYEEIAGRLRNQTHLEELPVMLLRPKQWNGKTVIWLDEHGKSGLFATETGATPRAELQRLLAAGAAVVGVDLFEQGEFLRDGKRLTHTRRVKNPREAAAYTFGYNYSLFAQRVHDVLTTVSFVRSDSRPTKFLAVVGLDGTGPIAAAARAQARGGIDAAVINTGGFRFGKILDLWDVNFLPGGAKYGDVPGMLALGAPGRLWLAGEGKAAPELVREIYRLGNGEKQVTAFEGSEAERSTAAVTWLLTAE